MLSDSEITFLVKAVREGCLLPYSLIVKYSFLESKFPKGNQGQGFHF